MKKRDWALILISGLVVLFSFIRREGFGEFTLQEVTFLATDTNYLSNKIFPGDHERLPLPQIGDIDADGLNDLLYFSDPVTMHMISGVDLQKTYSSKTLPLPKHTATTLASFGVVNGRNAVAVGTGYLDPLILTKADQTRKMFIVVLTNGWNVLCYDHQLNLIWESSVSDTLEENEYHVEATVSIVPVPQRNGDRGTVIVGGRIGKKPTHVPTLMHEHHFDGSNVEDFSAFLGVKILQESNTQNDTDTVNRKKKEFSEEIQEEQKGDLESNEHFSYYSFDGKTGTRRWKHEPGDFEDKQMHNEEIRETGSLDGSDLDILPFHSFKLHVFRPELHLGEQPWTAFTEDIINHLPHRWSDRDDTRMRVAHFRHKRTEGGGSSAPSGVITPGWSYGGTFTEEKVQANTYNAADLVNKPNVLLVDKRDGIEVVHYYSGRPLTTLRLHEFSAYADINGDSILDRVEASGSEGDREKCRATVTSGVPRMAQLFSASICFPESRFFPNLFFKGIEDIMKKGKEVPVYAEAVVPVVLHRTYSESHMYFLISNGKLTAYDSVGAVVFSINTKAKWTERSLHLEGWSSVGSKSDPVRKFMELAVRPSLNPFSIVAFAHPNHLLAVGSGAITLVSVDGHIVAESDITQGVPIARPVIGDCNSDGIEDIILVTNKGYLLYGLHHHSGGGIMVVVLIVLVLLFVSVMIVLISTGVVEYETDTAGVVARRNKIRRQLYNN